MVAITNRSKATTRSKAGFSLIELLVVVAIILIIAAIAIPSFLRSRMAANEASAAENVRTVTTAAIVYNTSWGNGYPPNIGAMGGTAYPATCDQAFLLAQTLTVAPNQTAGYTFAYKPQGAPVIAPAGCSAPGYNAYLVTAVPQVLGATGQRSFCSNQPGVIHFDPTGGAIGSPAACDALQTLQ